MADRRNDAGPSNSVMDDSLEQALGIASETFDPMRVLYSSSLELEEENVEMYNSVSQFVQNVKLGSSASMSTSEFDHELVNNRLNDTSLSPPVHGAGDILKTEITSDSNQTHSAPLVVTQTLPLLYSEAFVDKIKIKSKDAHTINETTQSATHDDDQGMGIPLLPDEASKTTTKDSHKTEEVTKKTTTRPRKVQRTVLTEMKTGFQVGPLSILKRSVEERLKVRVLTRSIRGIRGISTGYIVAFDKHMNMAMMDVDEVYRKPVGKHQKKIKNKDDKLPSNTEEMSTEDDSEELHYPKAPWQNVIKSGDNAALSGSSQNPHDGPSGSGHNAIDTDSEEIGDLLSAFSGTHIFSENSTTRLLGAKSRRLLERHLNQVLLRGESVVAVALAE